MDIGKRIKERREYLGMSQDELARKVGYKSRSSVNKIEMDGRGLPQSKIIAFANALETTPAYLMGWTQAQVFSGYSVAKDVEEGKISLHTEYYLDDTDKHTDTPIPYYMNEDARELAQFMFENPEYKVLFDASRKVKKSDIEFVKQMIDRMRGDGYDDTGC